MIHPRIVLFACACIVSTFLYGAKTPPRPIDMVSPDYPDELVATGADGSAVVQITINERGEVENPELYSATHDAFGRAALRAIENWSFEPATEDGVPIAIKTRVPFNFKAPSISEMDSAMARIHASVNQATGRDVFRDMSGETVVALKEAGGWKKPVKRSRPVYPEVLKAVGEEQYEVSVNVIVDKEGKVVNPMPVNLPNARLMVPAIMCAAMHEWEPFTKDGKPVCTEVEMKLRFNKNPRQGGQGGR